MKVVGVDLESSGVSVDVVCEVVVVRFVGSQRHGLNQIRQLNSLLGQEN